MIPKLLEELGKIDLEKIVLLILGWLFGLLAPAIVDSVRKRREAKEVRAAVLPELKELQYRLVLAVYVIEERHGKINRQLIEWIQPVLKRYRGVNLSENYVKLIDLHIPLTDEQYTQLTEITTPNSGGFLLLEKYPLPLFDSKMASLVWFNKTLRNQLLEIKTRIGFLNELVDDNRYFSNLTFQSSLTPENYKHAKENITNICMAYASQARSIVDLIGKIKI